MKTKTARFVMVTVFLLIATGLGILVGRWQITSAATSAAFPRGTYIMDLTRADVPAAFPPQAIPLLVGRYEFALAADGRTTMTKDGTVVVESRYAATQNQIAFYKDKGQYACDRVELAGPGRENPGAYSWAFDGKTLTFRKIADECAPRVLVLSVHPWAKQE